MYPFSAGGDKAGRWVRWGWPVKMLLLAVALLGLAGCGGGKAAGCVGDSFSVGFYAYFAPMSYSADADPAADGFNSQLGYEADLLTALEVMEGPGTTFARRGIGEWDGIWLKSAGPDFDLISGGITALEARTMDASGERVVRFTAGHVATRQSLLVRAGDAERLAGYADLTAEVRVGSLSGTTGEARLLQLTGLADADGALAAGTRVETPRGTVTADGSSDYTIAAAGGSANLEGRRMLYPPTDGMPQVVYLGDLLGETELLEALASGEVDAMSRSEISNRDAAGDSGGKLVITALDESAAEVGAFTLAADDGEQAACIDERISWLTDNRSIGYAEWLADSQVFMRRAETWGDGD